MFANEENILALCVLSSLLTFCWVIGFFLENKIYILVRFTHKDEVSTSRLSLLVYTYKMHFITSLCHLLLFSFSSLVEG